MNLSLFPISFLAMSQPSVYATSREFRAESAKGFPFEEGAMNNLKIPAGSYGPHITVSGAGHVIVDKQAYADDYLAFALGAMANNPKIAPEIKRLVARAIDLMDERAVARHGYSNSEREKNYVRVPCASRFE